MEPPAGSQHNTLQNRAQVATWGGARIISTASQETAHCARHNTLQQRRNRSQYSTMPHQAAAEELQDGRAPASRTRRAHCVRRRPEVQQRPPRTPAQLSRSDSEGTPRRPTLVRSAPTPALAAMRPPCARRRCARGPVREAHRASAAMAAWRRGARRNARRCPHLSESERVRASPSPGGRRHGAYGPAQSR